MSIGRIEPRMKRDAATNGIDLASGHLYLSPAQLGHQQRDFKKANGKAVSEQEMVDFVKDRTKMDLYWDGEAYIYTDYSSKFIIHPAYEMKISRNKTKKVNIITVGKANPTEFDDKKRFRQIK